MSGEIIIHRDISASINNAGDVVFIQWQDGEQDEITMHPDQLESIYLHIAQTLNIKEAQSSE